MAAKHEFAPNEMRGVVAVLVVGVVGTIWLGHRLLTEHTAPVDRSVREVTLWTFIFVVVIPIAELAVLYFLITEEDVPPFLRFLGLLALASFVSLLVLLGLDEGRARFGWEVTAAASDGGQTSATTAETTEAGIRAMLGLIPFIDLGAFGWDDPVRRGSIPFGVAVWTARLLIVLAVVYPLRQYVMQRRNRPAGPASTA